VGVGGGWGVWGGGGCCGLGCCCQPKGETTPGTDLRAKMAEDDLREDRLLGGGTRSHLSIPARCRHTLGKEESQESQKGTDWEHIPFSCHGGLAKGFRRLKAFRPEIRREGSWDWEEMELRCSHVAQKRRTYPRLLPEEAGEKE